MNTQTYTSEQEAVLQVLKEKPLTSSEIVAQVSHVSLLLELYPTLEILRNQGAIKSYHEGEVRYHYAA